MECSKHLLCENVTRLLKKPSVNGLTILYDLAARLSQGG
jgi:hypothetical protein